MSSGVSEERFIDRAYRAIAQMRSEQAREPQRLHVSSDWPDATKVWGIPVQVHDLLPPGTIRVEPMCREHVRDNGRCIWCGWEMLDNLRNDASTARLRLPLRQRKLPPLLDK